MDPHDLLLHFRFTDRGGARVYNILEPNLSADREISDPSGAPDHTVLGEIRLKDGEVTRFEWIKRTPIK